MKKYYKLTNKTSLFAQSFYTKRESMNNHIRAARFWQLLSPHQHADKNQVDVWKAWVRCVGIIESKCCVGVWNSYVICDVWAAELPWSLLSMESTRFGFSQHKHTHRKYSAASIWGYKLQLCCGLIHGLEIHQVA